MARSYLTVSGLFDRGQLNVSDILTGERYIQLTSTKASFEDVPGDGDNQALYVGLSGGQGQLLFGAKSCYYRLRYALAQIGSTTVEKPWQ